MFVFSGLKLNKTSTELLHLQCFEILKHFFKLQILIDWIPDDTPEEGLIMANHLAREGRSFLPIDDSLFSFIFCLCAHLRRNFLEYWSSRYARATTGSQLKQFFPSLFQLIAAQTQWF